MAEDVDPLKFLLELNLAFAAKEKPAKKSRSPGCRFRVKSTPPSLLTTAFRHRSDCLLSLTDDGRLVGVYAIASALGR
jgi:hypothetical protein